MSSVYVSSPSSGYLTRQICFLLNNYVYHEGEDTDNIGLMIPHYKAGGRTAPNGKVYPLNPTKKEDERDLVPVRSIVTKRKGDLNVITPDLISKKFKDFTDGAAIGYSFASSFTESTTQLALGLKHGGHERVLDKSGGLKAPKACTFSEEGKWIKLKVRGKELIYPRPDNIVTLGKDKYEEGEPVCYAYNSTSPMINLNSVISLLRAKPSLGTRYYEKENVVNSDCYALDDGEIIYTEDPTTGDILIHIGEREYQYNPTCMYYYPNGAKVKKYDRICSGVVNMNHVAYELKDDINAIYLIFRDQLRVYLPGTQEEIIELLFTGLINVTYNPKTELIKDIEYSGTHGAIMGKKSFFTTLSYGYSSKIIDKALKGEVNLSGDVMSEVVLGLLMNDRLDEK